MSTKLWHDEDAHIKRCRTRRSGMGAAFGWPDRWISPEKTKAAGAGEAAACGFIFFIATIASYVLYWFTRFMWYVLSSPVKDKFKFCGIKREAYDED